VVGEGGPADGAAAPFEDTAVGDAGVGPLATCVEGEALRAGDAVGEEEAEAPLGRAGLDFRCRARRDQEDGEEAGEKDEPRARQAAASHDRSRLVLRTCVLRTREFLDAMKFWLCRRAVSGIFKGAVVLRVVIAVLLFLYRRRVVNLKSHGGIEFRCTLVNRVSVPVRLEIEFPSLWVHSAIHVCTRCDWTLIEKGASVSHC
jgi:hypothetical protein